MSTPLTFTLITGKALLTLPVFIFVSQTQIRGDINSNPHARTHKVRAKHACKHALTKLILYDQYILVDFVLIA